MVNVNRKVVAGYGKGITGPTAVNGVSEAIAYHEQVGSDLKFYQWPVTFSDDSKEVAFWVNECYDSNDSEKDVIERVIAKAEKLAEIYNKGIA